jgi:two-component system CheB/CheR fusion protein
MANPFPDFDLIADARSVLDKLEVVHREVRANSGAWSTYRTAPYRTQDNRIKGVVISLSEISTIKSVELAAEEARAYAQGVIDTIGEPLIVLDEEMRIVSAGQAFYQLFDASPADTVGRLLPDSSANHLNLPALREFLDRAKASEGSQRSEIEVELPRRGRRILLVTARHIQRFAAATSLTLISFSDISNYRHSERQLADARRAAEQANLTKSRFLAAASHDLRQPLQTLMLLHDALRGEVEGAKALELLGRATISLDGMAGMLNALLDINQLETGAIQPQIADFPINDLLDKLRMEFASQAAARGLDWRVVRCGLWVHSDPRLLEQMLRNLVSNAIRYTAKGKVLLGCRRRGQGLRIGVWDTGIGIAEEEIPRIFEEYHQAAPGRQDGLGLGLAIVQRLGQLLNHGTTVRSLLGKGSAFAIEVPLAAQSAIQIPVALRPEAGLPGNGSILVIEDNAPLCEMLQLMLAGEGHRTAAAASGAAALALIAGNGFQPDLIVSDFALPGGINGVQTVAALRGALGRHVPAVYLTGDTRSGSLRDLAGDIGLAKPVRPEVLLHAIQQLLFAPPRTELPEAGAPATVFVIDDDRGVRQSMSDVLATAGYGVETYACADAFLAAYRAHSKGCLVTDVRMPGASGFELLARLRAAGSALPAIMITGHGDIAMAVEAMKAGAVDFIEKPVRAAELLACIERALRHVLSPSERSSWSNAAAMRIAGLTRREREVMDHVVAGHANKEIAARLGLAQRTVETHRANVMKKMGATSLSDLVRLVIGARGADPPSEFAADATAS